ncbi:PP2C family protein-serine/threonine phosphatase [Herbidospora yilanensis]|uniref:PP2C family protein-serine/threonine phosphatase n=1 Tax=Herbidospora yilanensis TaxID=354426 RepID=UPI0007C8404F|nr:protein phosphatase 2C domain-containing protein [Herbidospora yilanensis]
MNHSTLGLRYAARSDVGRRRPENEDAAYASPRLLVVADGMGGHNYGQVASATAIRVLSGAHLEGDPVVALEGAIQQAAQTLKGMADANPALNGMGTTLTAMLWDGSGFALAHVGDSRGYMLRDGVLYQITHDHTLVQSLVDDGRMTPEQAAEHPRRSMLMRALESTGNVSPDVSHRAAFAGDRYLLCSDGLAGVVSPETLHELLTSVADLDQLVTTLVDLANRGGGPDNITCVVADVVAGWSGDGHPIMVGSASADQDTRLDQGEGTGGDVPLQTS